MLAAVWRLAVPGAFALVVWPLLLIPVSSLQAPQVALQQPAPQMRPQELTTQSKRAQNVTALPRRSALHEVRAATAATIHKNQPSRNNGVHPIEPGSVTLQPLDSEPQSVQLAGYETSEMPLRQPASLAAYAAPEELPEPEVEPAPLVEPTPETGGDKPSTETTASPLPAGESPPEEIVIDGVADPLEPLFGAALGMSPVVQDAGCGCGASDGACSTCGDPGGCECGLCVNPCSKAGQFLSFFDASCGGGIGLQRVGLAPFEIDVTEPFNHFDIQVNPVFGINSPDRAEYFWPRAGRGVPNVEQSVNYQDLRFRMEVGNDFASTITELPLRFLDPQINSNTGGLADMNTAVKTRLFQGATLNISQIVRTYLNTGSITHGLSSGHISIEPGVLARYEWSERTFLFGEMKFWVPLGGDPTHSGEILRYGAGISHLWIDNDSFAAIPVLEFVAWNILGGQRTLPASAQPTTGGPLTRSIDGDVIFNIFPGMRFTFKGGENFDLFELGVNGGVAVSNQRWYNAQMRFEARWMF